MSDFPAFQIIQPTTKTDFSRYYAFRWKMLREPWQQPQGSEIDQLESQSIHRMILNDVGDVIGVGRLHKTSQYQAQIRYMAVSDDYQGKGLGRLIIDALECAAVRHGVKEITLNAREVALDFYLRLGYEQIEKSHLLYGEIQHYLMHKALSEGSGSYVAESLALTKTWHETIPMSKAMNLQVSHFDGNELFTSCELSFNKNLHNTMFAGSIYTLATLTGWAWCYMLLNKYNIMGDIVLANADIKYLAPIEGCAVGYTGKALISTDEAAFAKKLSVKGRSSLSLTVNVMSGDMKAATFVGKFAVIATSPSKAEHSF